MEHISVACVEDWLTKIRQVQRTENITPRQRFQQDNVHASRRPKAKQKNQLLLRKAVQRLQQRQQIQRLQRRSVNLIKDLSLKKEPSTHLCISSFFMAIHFFIFGLKTREAR